MKIFNFKKEENQAEEIKDIASAGTPLENPRHEKFCLLYATNKTYFCNGTQSYMEAFGIDTNKPGAYNSVKVSAHDLLLRDDVINRISELLEFEGLNQSFLDKELLKLVKQDVDFPSKIRAIQHANKLLNRIIDRSENRSDLTSGGRPINEPNISPYSEEQLNRILEHRLFSYLDTVLDLKNSEQDRELYRNIQEKLSEATKKREEKESMAKKLTGILPAELSEENREKINQAINNQEEINN